MRDPVTCTHPEVGTIRCERAAYTSNYQSKGFVLNDDPDAPTGAIQHVGGGVYELPDGKRVRGRDAATDALAEPSNNEAEEATDTDNEEQ